MKRKKKIPSGLHWKLRKYARWLRVYVRRVQMTEKEIGGRIDAC